MEFDSTTTAILTAAFAGSIVKLVVTKPPKAADWVFTTVCGTLLALYITKPVVKLLIKNLPAVLAAFDFHGSIEGFDDPADWWLPTAFLISLSGMGIVKRFIVRVHGDDQRTP